MGHGSILATNRCRHRVDKIVYLVVLQNSGNPSFDIPCIIFDIHVRNRKIRVPAKASVDHYCSPRHQSLPYPAVMTMTLLELAEIVDGELSGNPKLTISGASPISSAKPGQITLADSPKYIQQLDASAASAVLLPRGLNTTAMPFITVDDVHNSFSRVVAHFLPTRAQRKFGISSTAIISPSANIQADVDIHDGVTIGDDVQIGTGTVIHSGVRVMAGCQLAEDIIIFPNSVLYENTIVGPRCVIHAGSIIGAYGFGYSTVDGQHLCSPQLGHVKIGADVEVGAGTTIDRGTYNATVIGEGTKIDNQVMIAHNCHIGRHNIICSQVGIAGSCTTGDYVTLAGQVGIRDHVRIGDRTSLGAKSGVMADIPADSKHFGIPATPEKTQLKILAALGRLPAMRKQLKNLERTVERLWGSTGPSSNRHQDDAA